MSALTRQSIVRGHGQVIMPGPVTIPCAGGIEADIEIKDLELDADDIAKFDRRLQDIMGKITFTPAGILTQAIIDALYPAALRTPVLGTSLFGAVDVPYIIHSKAGQKVTFNSGALTKMPSLNLGVTKQLYGAAEITALRGNGLEWSNAAALYTLSAASYVDSVIKSIEVPTRPYTGAWGSILASIVPESGWTVDFTVDTSPDQIDGYGTSDYILNSVGCIAKCRPKNLSETQLDALLVQNTGVAIGMSRRRAANLVISSGIAVGDLSVTLYDACILRGPLQWKGVEVRPNEIAFAASRTETSGVYGALFAIAIASA